MYFSQINATISAVLDIQTSNVPLLFDYLSPNRAHYAEIYHHECLYRLYFEWRPSIYYPRTMFPLSVLYQPYQDMPFRSTTIRTIYKEITDKVKHPIKFINTLSRIELIKPIYIH